MSVDSAWGLRVDDLKIAGCKPSGLLWQPGCTFSGMFLLTKNKVASVLVLLGLQTTIHLASAQPGRLSPPQLDQLVSRIALYPDPLLAQVLTASTYWPQIPEAAEWAAQHGHLSSDALAQAVQEDNLPWDPSVLALLPIPSVLDMMAKDMAWTEQLVNAVLMQRAEVMDAVQRMRKRAMDYGYLLPNSYVNVVSNSGYIEILPYVPGVIYVPEYDPAVVFRRPTFGLAIGGAIRFGRGIAITPFAPWGWATAGFVWPSHMVIFDRAPWGRVWANREVYRHPNAHPWVRAAGPRVR